MRMTARRFGSNPNTRACSHAELVASSATSKRTCRPPPHRITRSGLRDTEAVGKSSNPWGRVAVDVAGGALVLVDIIKPIGDQASGGDEVAIEVDCGQLVSDRQRDDQIVMKRPGPRERGVRRVKQGRKPGLAYERLT